MKNFKIILSVLFVMSLFFGCQDELPELDQLVLVEQLDYQITQNPDDPNMIILESFTPGVIPQWVTPMGRSTRIKDTVLLAFPNTYKFVYSVQGGGGYVSADTVVLDITTTNLSYVDDPLWNAITGGGPGNSKTWVLDIDEEGNTKHWNSPMYFSGDAWRWQGSCSNPDESVCWIWEPDWSGNQWISAANDFGTMTFSLEGGAFIEVEHMNSPGRESESGTFFLNIGDKTIEMTDAAPLMNDWADGGNIDDWSLGYLITLTDEAMQIGYKDKGKEEFIIFNYISEEYADNWVPEEEGEPEPDLPDGWMDDVSSIVNNELTWVLSPETPFNWASLDGTFLNDWNSIDDYPDWSGFDESVPATYSDFSITFNSSDYTVEYVDAIGNVSDGTYTLDETGTYTFTGAVPEVSIGSAITLHTTAENQWRILSIEKDESGSVTGMWVGARSTEKDEYEAYHLILQQDIGEVDPMDVWINALAGKTFVPDVVWFLDWINAPPAFGGGWTSATTFEDFTSTSWVWDEDAYDIAQSASLMFFMDGDQMKVTVSQTLTTEHQDDPPDGPWITDDVNESYSVTGNVNIDTDAKTLTFDVPLIDYAGSAARWLEENGTDGTGEWFFAPHGGSNLANIDENGLWLGYLTPGNSAETTTFHFVVE